MPDTVSTATVSTDLGHRMLGAAEAKAAELGIPVSIAILDQGGLLKMFSRQDPELLATMPTGIKEIVMLGGGYPSVVDGQHVGAIGVSGGQVSDDMAIAKAALAPDGRLIGGSPPPSTIG